MILSGLRMKTQDMQSFKCTIYCLIFVCVVTTAAVWHIPTRDTSSPRTERIKINTKEAFGAEMNGFPFELVNESWLKLSDRWEAKLLNQTVSHPIL
jgi:hypothetical protein